MALIYSLLQSDFSDLISVLSFKNKITDDEKYKV